MAHSYRQWNTSGVPADCAICGAPIQWTGRQYLHVAPAAPREMRAEPGSDEYTAGQIGWGYELGDWIMRTCTHEARLDP